MDRNVNEWKGGWMEIVWVVGWWVIGWMNGKMD